MSILFKYFFQYFFNIHGITKFRYQFNEFLSDTFDKTLYKSNALLFLLTFKLTLN